MQLHGASLARRWKGQAGQSFRHGLLNIRFKRGRKLEILPRENTGICTKPKAGQLYIKSARRVRKGKKKATSSKRPPL